MADRYEPVTLFEWVEMHSGEDDLRNVFLNLDIALKYIHDHGYCVDVFYPTTIEILDNHPDHIRFQKLIELSSDPLRRKEMIREDLFRSSFIQIGLYSNSLKYLKPEFLKENFDSFVQFLPSGDVPYYRGIVQRNAIVYLCEYDYEKRNRDLASLNEQIGESGNSNQGQLVKSNGRNVGVQPINNDNINNSIYRQINGLNDLAFVNVLIIPTTILFVLFVLAVISWITSFLF